MQQPTTSMPSGSTGFWDLDPLTVLSGLCLPILDQATLVSSHALNMHAHAAPPHSAITANTQPAGGDILRLHRGIRLRISRNLDKANGFVNGTLGIAAFLVWQVMILQPLS